MPIVLRSSKNAALTFAEMDGNFTDLNIRINTKLDSTGVTSLINSSYIETIVDSSYVQLRQSMTGSYQNSDVDAHLNTNTASSGHILKWNGLDYIWDSDLGGDLSVSTMGASGGGALSFDNSTGIFTYRPADLSGYVQIGSETSTLNDVIQRGHTTTTTAVIPFLYSNQGSFPNASTYHGAMAHSDADGAMYFAHAGAWHKLANDSDLNGNIDAHLNVSGASSGQVLSWNGTDYAWVADQTGSGGAETDPIVGAINGIVKADGAGNISAAVAGTDYSTFDGDYNSLTNKPTIPTAYTDSDVDAHLNVSGAASGQVLSWNGTDYAWVADQTGSGGGGLDSAGVASYLSGNWDFHLLPETNATYDIGSAEYKVRHLYLSNNSLFFDSGQTSIGFESVGTSKNLKFNNNIVKEASHVEEAGGPADSEYNNGALIAENNGTVFNRALTINGLKLVVAGAVGGQLAVPDEWALKTARTFELMTDSNGAGINTTHQRNFLKTLKGDAGTKHAGIPTVQRVGYGGGSTYTPNWLEDSGIPSYAGLQAFNASVAQKDMVWYRNISGPNPPTQRGDIEEIFEHIFHTIHAFGIPGAVPGSADAVEMNPDIRIGNEPSFDWQNTALHLAMKEAIDAGLYDPSGYATDWNTDPEKAAVAYTEYTYLVNWSMWDMSVYWDGGSLSPEWDDSLKTPAGMLANNPLGHALFNTYFAPVLSKPNFTTIESIFGENDTGVSGYVADVLVGGPVDISKTNHFVTTGTTYDLPNGEYVGQELKFWHKTQGVTNTVRVNVLNAKWRNGVGVLSIIPNMLWDQDKENTACYSCIWDGEAWIIGEGSLGA
jgi:hypothetical protein